MKKKKIILIVIAVAAAVAAGFAVFKGSGQEKKDAAIQRVVTAQRGTIETTVEATGEVSPLNRVEIKPPIQGRIEDILVDEGSRVRKGQILAWMSSSDRAAILDAARAQGADVAKRWEDSYKPTPIMAPLSGDIILRNIVVGQTVDQSTVLFALSDKLIVLAQVDEVDIGRIASGMPARITLDAYPKMPIPGKVFNVLFEGKNVSNVITYGVKVEPAKIPPFFRSQMTANISFIIAQKEDALLVPAAAVRDRRGVKEVLLPGPKGKNESREITTGIENGDQVEILSGLEEGQEVVISQKRYSPQQAGSSSPLVAQPGRGGRQGGGGGGRGGGR